MNVASSVRRPMNRDSHVKKSVLANSKISAMKVEVYVRKNKQTEPISANVISNKENVIDVDVANSPKGKVVLCVSCMKNVLIPCHDKCLANYKLNVHSNVRRALFTNPRTPKSSDTTHVVSKTRFSKKLTQSKSLDTTPIVSKTKIDVGLGHNLFSVGQFCDGNLEVAFRSKTCYVRNLKGDDLLTGGLPKFKYGKDHLCFACERGKSKKVSHPPKLVPSEHSKLELLHMDLCGPMRVASTNGNKYILMIVDDYSRYTWVYFLHSKDETPKVIKKFIAQAQLNYKAKVCKIHTKFKNTTLKAHYEMLGIMKQFSTACTP
ncbi:retrovirus-related pol polyprotein from transposon TNT 1-94 [Tanacetum coccineum]|uniref:Retrovirus-related pol polyprotein from transposon TNT 1-94 n=1 Tax=Tanacetum coccineum TaxID=301880 RepID=A0ABQ5BTT1_9ASTR